MHVARLAAYLLLVGLLMAPASAGDGEDVWTGKHRVDIVALLGEPNKTKKSSDGSALMVYKLIRVGDKAVPNPSFRVLDLPGVGRVGRVVKNEDPGVSETTTIEPTGFDDRGRPSAGGLGRSRTASRTWDPEKGEWTGLEPPEKGPRTRGKLKLVFTLDADEIVQDWSVSPK